MSTRLDRYNREKQDAEALSQFETAKKRLHESGIVPIFELIAEEIPELSYKLVDDFKEAGGHGMPPYVALKTEKKEVKPGVTVHQTLQVYPIVFKPSELEVCIWRSTIYPGENNNSHSRDWSAHTTSAEKLPELVMEGLLKMVVSKSVAFGVGEVARSVGQFVK